ncbi:MAG: hypothetical protein ACJ72T_11550, partial [Nitrososphaeraceae archaeon]
MRSFNSLTSLVLHWLAEKYVKGIYSKKIVFGKSNCSLGKKYCRRCEVYLYNDGLFCPCCGMQLRLTPYNKEGKE